MKYIYTLFFILSAFITSAQVRSISYGTEDDENGFVQPLSNGNYLMVGQVKHKGNRSDIILSRLDSNFTIIWSQVYDIAQTERFWNVLEMPDGNLLFTATASGIRTNNDFTYLGLINGSTGKIIWTERRGGNQDRLPYLKRLENGNILVGGMLEGETGTSWNKFSLVKLNADYSIQWQYFYNHIHPQSIEPPSGEITMADDIIVQDDGYLLLGSHSKEVVGGMRLLKVDKQGRFLWLKQYHFPVNYKINHVIPFTKSGVKGMLIAGGIVDETRGIGVGMLTFLDNNGKHIWTKNYIAGKTTLFNYLTLMDDGAAVVVGTVDGAGQGGKNLLAMKIDSTSAMVWAKTYGGDGDETGERIHHVKGKLLMSGTTNSNSGGNGDIYMVATDSSGDISRECMRDITSDVVFFTVVPVELQTIYKQGTVPSPKAVSIRSNPYAMQTSDVCAGCVPIELGLDNTTRSICNGNPLLLSMPPMRGTYEWSNGKLGQKIAINKPGVYWLKAINECDTAIDTFYVDERNSPSVPLLKDTVVCFDQQLTYLLTPTANHSYRWLPMDTVANKISLPAGDYRLVAENYCGRVSTDLTITSVGDYELPLPDITECLYTSFTVDLSSYSRQGINLYWPHLNDSVSTVTLTDSGYYTVISERCEIVKVQDFKFNWASEYVFMPNAFTPNGEGPNENETFKVGSYVREDHYLLQIYTRWGELIFTTADPQEGWDGTYKGKPAQTGAYLYVIAIKNCDGIMQYNRGSVTLLR